LLLTYDCSIPFNQSINQSIDCFRLQCPKSIVALVERWNGGMGGGGSGGGGWMAVINLKGMLCLSIRLGLLRTVLIAP